MNLIKYDFLVLMIKDIFIRMESAPYGHYKTNKIKQQEKYWVNRITLKIENLKRKSNKIEQQGKHWANIINLRLGHLKIKTILKRTVIKNERIRLQAEMDIKQMSKEEKFI